MAYPFTASLGFLGGYCPTQILLGVGERPNTLYKGQNAWIRPSGRVEAALGLSQVSATNVGARLFPFGTQRASVNGTYASVVRYLNAAMLFLSDSTGAQVYLDEAAPAGTLTTSSTAGQLRIGLLSGGSWSSFNAGFAAPTLTTVTAGAGGTKSMTGQCGVAVSPWRILTDSEGPPSNTVYVTCAPTTNDLITVTLPSAASGQTGWTVSGTRWGDSSGGELRPVRYVRINPRGTFAATNGNVNLTGTSTHWLEELAPGDVTDAGTIATVTSDTAATLTAGYGGVTGSGKTLTVTGAAVEWRNDERGDRVINPDKMAAPPARGLVLIGNKAFLWGVEDEKGAHCIVQPLDDFDVEHVDATTQIVSQDGQDILGVVPGDSKLWLLTANSLQVITFTQRDELPYILKTAHTPGFANTRGAALYRDVLYGFSRGPFRTASDEDQMADTQFAAAVYDEWKSWTAANVIVAVDPLSEAVVYMHYDGSSTTTCLPFMVNLGVWGPPIKVTGRINDAAIVNGTLYCDLYSGGNYRVNTWEGGTGLSNAYAVTPFTDFGIDGGRHTVKELSVTGKVTNAYLYRIQPGGSVPDVTDTSAAAASLTLSDNLGAEARKTVNLVGQRATAVRVDLSATSGRVDEIAVSGGPWEMRR